MRTGAKKKPYIDIYNHKAISSTNNNNNNNNIILKIKRVKKIDSRQKIVDGNENKRNKRIHWFEVPTR